MNALSGPLGYVIALGLASLYVFLSFTPFEWDPPGRVANGAKRSNGTAYFETPGQMYTAAPPAWLESAIQANELELHLRIMSLSREQDGPARIFTVSVDPHRRNLTIAQKGDSLVIRLRTQNTTLNGLPEHTIPALFEDSREIDLHLTIHDRSLMLIIGNEIALQKILPAAPLSNWDPSYQVALGNELTGDRPWLGKITAVEVRVRDAKFDYINEQNMEIPATYWRLPDWKRVVMMPFSGERWREQLRDPFLNLLCFVPFGFVLGCIKPFSTSFRLVVLFVAALSFFVEICQFGFAQRYPSLLDWLMNILGTMFGFGISRCLQRKIILSDIH